MGVSRSGKFEKQREGKANPELNTRGNIKPLVVLAENASKHTLRALAFVRTTDQYRIQTPLRLSNNMNANSTQLPFPDFQIYQQDLQFNDTRPRQAYVSYDPPFVVSQLLTPDLSCQTV